MRWSRLVALVMVVGMFFGLFGCGKSLTPEEMARKYLQKTYKKTFVLEDLSKKEGGPFSSREYSGFAYEEGKPLERFTVWVDKDESKVYDSSYSLPVLPGISQWVADAAGEVWPNAQTGVMLDVFRYNANADYRPEEYLRFLSEESVDISVILVLPRESLTLDTYWKFREILNGSANGYVRIFFAPEEDVANVRITDLLQTEPDISLYIGATMTVIKEQIPE